jgi:2-keto-4-pentenoate hydratase
MDAAEMTKFAHAKKIAQRFVAARMNALALADFPGPIPPDLASAYQVQDEAIKLWPDAVAGWKIGKIGEDIQAKYGSHRLGGPIFSRAVKKSDGLAPIEVGLFVGGFAAVEAEFIFEIAYDAPAEKTEWTIPEAAEIAGRLLIGIEMAGSPLATINALGPCVIVSDFGNNADEIVGGEIRGWREMKWEDLAVETFIDGASVGRGSAAFIPGSPLESLQFIAGNVASRGLPLKKGTLISTGAATGVHDIKVGQKARVEFKGFGSFDLVTKPRTIETL